MLSIGEFSKICNVSTKTLRYYAELDLLLPSVINPENGYRYYAIEQLEIMLFIDRLKSYHFSLEEIKRMIKSDEPQDELLYLELNRKKKDMEGQIQTFHKTLEQLENDMIVLKQGKSIMSYLNEIDVQLVEVPSMYLLSKRSMIHKDELADGYRYHFKDLIGKIRNEHLTMIAPPMVLFHNDEYSPYGLDIEFAIPVKECVTGTRDFRPGLCIKTTLQGSYQSLPSVYTKQREWAEQNGYENKDALYEVYINDPSQVFDESELKTEIYYPVKKIATKNHG